MGLEKVVTSVCSILAADATIQGLLGKQGDGTTAAVFGTDGPIPDDVNFPALRVFIVDDVPDPQMSAIGMYDARLQIDILGTRKSVREQILERIDVLLDIPRSRADPITATGYTVKRMRRTGRAVTLLTRLEVDSIPVRQMATDWILRVVKTT